MLQQFNPMCRTVEVLRGERYVPGRDVITRSTGVDLDRRSWRDEPPPPRCNTIRNRHNPALYTINRFYNARGIEKHITQPATPHALVILHAPDRSTLLPIHAPIHRFSPLYTAHWHSFLKKDFTV